jgi:epoxyqueuosine reductase
MRLRAGRRGPRGASGRPLTHYQAWVDAGFAGEMRYLTDRRAADARRSARLLPRPVRSICVGKLYNAPQPYSTQFDDVELAWISRYAWGDDYHRVLRRACGLEASSANVSRRAVRFENLRGHRAAAGAHLCAPGGAGLDRQEHLPDQPAARIVVFPGRVAGFARNRGPTLRRPTAAAPAAAVSTPAPRQAIVPFGGRHAVDSRLCISYLTIELRGAIAEDRRAGNGGHVFGCDICQDVCPWNRRAPVTGDVAFHPRQFAPPLERLAALSEAEFRGLFAGTPVWRARYAGFLRNVAVAMGNRAASLNSAPRWKNWQHRKTRWSPTTRAGRWAGSAEHPLPPPNQRKAERGSVAAPACAEQSPLCPVVS